jgi:hypothetical protein
MSVCNIEYKVTQRGQLESYLSFAKMAYKMFKNADSIKQSIKKSYGPENN